MSYAFLCFPLACHLCGHVVERVLEIERIEANPDRCDLEPPRQLHGRFLHITDLHPDPLYLVGGSVSTACHRKKPKKEKPRAGYLGTPYESVVPPRVRHRFRSPRSETLGPVIRRMVAKFNLGYSLL